jgi:O-antigen/teichoic acid export membrane protein
MNCGVAAVVTLPIILLAKLIMSSYGAGFASGAWVMIILVASAGIAVAAGVAQQALTSRGMMWTSLSFLIIWSVVLLISSVVLVKDHGATGLAVAHLIAYLVYAGCLYAYFRIARIGSA